jgi:uncharacterized protein YkwD
MSRAAILIPLLLSACIVVPVPLGVIVPSAPARASAATGPVTNWPASAHCAVPARSASDGPMLLALINAERLKAGLSPVKLSAPLSAMSHKHACDTAAGQSVSHVGSDGATLAQRLQREDIRVSFAAENTGLGFDSPQIAVEWWMNSSGHRANILAPQVTQIGVGQADGVPRPTWVLNFIKPR